MNWEQRKAQFKELTRIFVAIENMVIAEGKVNATHINHLAEEAHLSPLGIEVLSDFIKQSERILVQQENDQTYLIPNPEYVAEETIP